ncbi:MAG: hypothetical protein ACHQJD_01740 [Thermoanaerobaculia bacterium]
MKRLFSFLSGALFLSSTLTAWAAGDRTPSSTSPPITTWQAPAFYTSPHSGRTALTDAAAPMPYIPLVPCRQYDSRSTTALLQNTPRTVTLSGAPCGIPASAAAIAVNITIFNISGASGNGVFKVDTVSPPATAWINYPSYETQRGNAGVVSTNGSGAIVVGVYQGAGSVDFTVDVFGYYGATPANGQNTFTLNNNSTLYTMFLTNSSTTCSGACGVYQSTASGDAFWGDAARDGVHGHGARNGVYGITNATTGDHAGVTGYDGTGVTWTGSTIVGPAGVSGWGQTGVAGATNSGFNFGVIGVRLLSSTTYGAFGVLGYSNYGVWALGDYGGTGVKYFVEPHPTDPSKVIRYVSLEGNESGTYFRGTAQIVNGEAVIPVPESFKFVTDEAGLTVQVTPVGAPAVVWVASQDLDQIVLRSTKDVTVHYFAQGFRRAYKDLEVIADGQEYRPNSPDQTIPTPLSAEAKSRLIQNGTYNPDGTVNMATAERLGWAQQWREQAAAAAAASKRTAATAGATPGKN